MSVPHPAQSAIEFGELITIDATQEADALVLHVSGDVCHFTAPTFRVALEGARDSGAGAIVVDLSTTTLFGAAGITELARIISRGDGLHVELRIRGASRLIDQVLRLCGFEAYLEEDRPSQFLVTNA